MVQPTEEERSLLLVQVYAPTSDFPARVFTSVFLCSEIIGFCVTLSQVLRSADPDGKVNYFEMANNLRTLKVRNLKTLCYDSGQPSWTT